MNGGTERRRILIAGGTLLLLLAVVGLASRARTPTGGDGTRALDGDILLEYALLLTLALAVVVVPVAIWALVARLKEEEEEEVLPARRRNWMPAVLLTMCGVAIVSSLLVGRSSLLHHRTHPGSPVKPLAALAQRRSTARAVRFDWLPVIVVSSLTAAGLTAAAFVLVRRRAPAPARHAAETLVLALERTIDDLRGEPDPRRAVIAAYAQMEAALGRSGFSRAPSEAPREYLQRVLPEVGAGADSVERLTALFERAKFSPHAIDAQMKDEAIDALELLRDQLRSVT